METPKWSKQKGKPLKNKETQMCSNIPEKTATMADKQGQETEISKNQWPIEELKRKNKNRVEELNVQTKNMHRKTQ